MAATVQEALQRMTALPGVRAGFVFDSFSNVPAAQMPEGYEASLLKTLAQQMLGFANASRPKGQAMQEIRIAYGQGLLHVKFFGQAGQDGGCALFFSSDVDLALLEQPLKLGAVVLQKTLSAVGTGQSALGQMALAAEQALQEASENDASFAGAFRRLCFESMGSFGRRLFDNALEKESLAPPLRNEDEMRRLVNAVAQAVPHPLVRMLLVEKALGLIQDKMGF